MEIVVRQVRAAASSLELLPQEGCGAPPVKHREPEPNGNLKHREPEPNGNLKHREPEANGNLKHREPASSLELLPQEG